MTVSKHSPNWYWQQLGAKIERREKPRHRVITMPDGVSFCAVAVADKDRHAAEIKLAKLLTPVTA